MQRQGSWPKGQVTNVWVHGLTQSREPEITSDMLSLAHMVAEPELFCSGSRLGGISWLTYVDHAVLITCLRCRLLNRTVFSICVKRKYRLIHPPTPLFADLRQENTYTFEHYHNFIESVGTVYFHLTCLIIQIIPYRSFLFSLKVNMEMIYSNNKKRKISPFQCVRIFPHFYLP